MPDNRGMFICEHCRQDIEVDRNDPTAEILLAITKHQLEECISMPKWALSMPPQFKPNVGHAAK